MSAQAAPKPAAPKPAAPKPATPKPAADAAPAKEGSGEPKKKSKLLLIIIAAVVVLGGGAGAFFALKKKSPAADASSASTASADKAAAKEDKPGAKKATPSYFKFDPAFVVNFGGEGSARYLQVTVEAMSRDPKVIEDLKVDEPAVRNDLVMLFSSQDNATLMSPDGRDKLRASTLDIVRKVLNAEGSNGKALEAVYFTSFVIQ
jgi:flagellar FliL protein